MGSKAIQTYRALVSEARWRGMWGTIRAVKAGKFGYQKYFIAEDELGNKFFENPNETFGRDRWVEYSDMSKVDSSNISPRWHAWLHRMNDSPDAVPPNPVYAREVTRNMTGTDQAYVPSAHRNAAQSSGPAKEKYESWVPQNKGKGVDSPVGSKDVLDLK